MKYVDYGTMQSDAQRRVFEMQRRARDAVASQPCGEACAADDTARCVCALPAAAQTRSSDGMLIAVLAALLLAEGADGALILALVYLMI